jgi:acyl-[acyl-carrier-protein]-phospholipid O-acyltransferase/long-chain-fatty-acid--[acyl-carrier-protein] ligase
MIVTIASGLYVVSYVFFSPLAGKLAKIYSKRKIMIVARLVEIPLFLAGIAGFWFRDVYTVMSVIFLLGLVSTLFSPSKYGLIRDIGGQKGISFGTGTLEMLTFFGVLIGTLAASLVSDHFGMLLLASVSIIASLLAFWSAWSIKADESEPESGADDTLNPLLFLVRSYKFAGVIKGMNWVVTGLSVFWMTGNLIQMNLMVHCQEALGMTNTETGIVMTFCAVGIGLGSYLTGLLSRGKIQTGFVPYGGAGAVLTLLLVFVLQPAGWVFTALVFCAAFFLGVYMVPLSASVQNSVEGRGQGIMIAYSNFVIFLFILLSSGLFGATAKFFDTNSVFLVIVVLMLMSTWILTARVPGMAKASMGIFRN